MHEFETRRAVHSHNGIGEGGYMASRIVRYLAGIVETVLALRLVFRAIGASPASGFVSFIYNLSEPFVAPFRGILRSIYTAGVETQAVIEPATIVALIIYPLVAWGVIRLIQTISHGAHAHREHVHPRF